MLYGKLPIVFLSTIASDKKDTTNSAIARHILDHRNDVKSMTISELAIECGVATSSISRFCKEIGLQGFGELKELLSDQDLIFEQDDLKQYTNRVQESLTLVIDSVDQSKISQLCHDIYSFKQVAVFGLMKAGAVALCLQSDLLMLGKQVYTHIAYDQQMDYILNANEENLIIIFSYTGSYFDYPRLRSEKKNLFKPKIWMISSEIRDEEFIDDYIIFNSKQDQMSHPYQLQLIAGMISQIYAKTPKI